MLDKLLDWWQFSSTLGLISLIVGFAVIAPLILNKSFRKWLARSDVDIEAIGLITLTLTLVAIGCYNFFSSASGD